MSELIKKLKELLGDVFASLSGKTEEEAVAISTEAVGEEKISEIVSELNDAEKSEFWSLATESGVNGGDENLNSEKIEETSTEEVKVEASTVEGGTEVVEETVEKSETNVEEEAAVEGSESAEASLKARVEELEKLLHDQIVASAVEIEAIKAGIKNPEDAHFMINPAVVEVEGGKAVGVVELIAELKKNRPYLFESKVVAEGGFNPATPSEFDAVEAAFYRRNPELRK